MVHKPIVYTAIFVLIILQIASFVSFSSRITKLNAELETTQENLTSYFVNTLDEYNLRYQNNFNEISKTLTKQQTNLNEEIKLLKSSKDDFSGIIDDAVKGVVSISTDKAMGTGFVINSSGYIVTNYHVIDGSKKINIIDYDKSITSARFVGGDATRDIALLKADKIFASLEFADSDNLQVGKKVIAIGNPLGLSFTVTEGIISALNRAGPNGLEEYIQTDVSLNPGNSGGPLIDTFGKVIGINNFKIGNAESLGFALESNAAKKLINKIAKQTITG